MFIGFNIKFYMVFKRFLFSFKMIFLFVSDISCTCGGLTQKPMLSLRDHGMQRFCPFPLASMFR